MHIRAIDHFQSIDIPEVLVIDHLACIRYIDMTHLILGSSKISSTSSQF